MEIMEFAPQMRQFEHHCSEEKPGEWSVTVQLGFTTIWMNSNNHALAHALVEWFAIMSVEAVETPKERWN